MWDRYRKKDYKDQDEQTPFEILMDMTKSRTKGDVYSIILLFIIYSAVALLGNLDGDKCGILVAWLSVDILSGIIVAIIPVSCFIISKLNIHSAIAFFYQVFFILLILLLHKHYTAYSFVQWEIAFCAVELMCYVLSKDYRAPTLGAFLISIMAVIMILLLRKGIDATLYTVSPIHLVAGVALAAIFCSFIKIMPQKNREQI